MLFVMVFGTDNMAYSLYFATVNSFFFLFYSIHNIPAYFCLDLFFFVKVSTLGKHSVTKFEGTDVMVRCTDNPGTHLVTECLLKEQTLFRSI